jgi:magnesium transporter
MTSTPARSLRRLTQPRRGGGVDLVHKDRPLHPGGSLEQAVVDCAVYSSGLRRPGKVALGDALEAAEHEDGFVWIGLYQPNAQCLQQVADRFGLHPLAVEDAVMAHQRPKLETYGDDSHFVVLKTIRYVDREEVIETGELMLFVGKRFVVTVRHGEGSELRSVRAELESHPDRMRQGPVAVLYAVLDRVVDGYLPAADAVEEDVDEIEEQVFAPGRKQPTERIYKLKRELVEFRRAVEPLRAATSALAEGRVKGIDVISAEWFRDVHDHVERAADQVSTMDALLDSALSANLAQVSVQQNDDMRKISAWVAIGAVSTLVAGIYGMNFEHMPELGWQYGYLWALSLMGLMSVLLYRTFKRNDWL